ncbi:FxsB family cyclophane-forming radical SAM/SPASM peptide maturase [Actinomadura sp. 3N508]|uniref:FxsB family cyclophane-forming radical SAM/SPASM peptide maturase n=1 Tax=Actinomadura sp. 3N508 TaxID=3375153 RepID=UPI0037B578CC
MAPSTLFRQFVLKVHSRCDLACDHCYVFEHADQSWRRRPVMMSVATMDRTAERIADHARRHGLAHVSLVLHGGEPLLCGPDHLAALLSALKGRLSHVCDFDLGMQTNGVLLDRRFCALLRDHGVKIGISLDGDRQANDRHRSYRDGRSSYDKVIRAIDLLRGDYPELYSGLLCTIDIANDPITVYEALIAHEPPKIDFLLPHHTWERPPPGSATGPSAGETPATPYADWLQVIADRWLSDDRPVPVRMFDSIIRTTVGRTGLVESLGLEASDLLVVESDGTYEQVDSLKTAFDGAPDTGMDVFRHSIDDVASVAGIKARQGGLAALCETCQDCPVVATCGGGLFAHRYRADGSGFANPSVYCGDLFALIGNLQESITRQPYILPPAVVLSVATGHGDRATMARLGDAQRIGCRGLVTAIGARTGPSAGRDAVNRVRAADPDAYDRALSYPHVRAWALERVRALNRNNGAADDGLLATVACVAAARAAESVTLTVPVRGGAVHLPGIGRYDVPSREETTVRVDAGRIEVDGATAVEAVRYLTAGRFTVMLDDLDPFRDRHVRPAAPRLDTDQFARWEASFREAWSLLEKEYAEYAPAIAEGLTTIVPLTAPKSGASVSSTVRDAYGAVGIALPDSPAVLCLLILHEFQHVKLGGVLDFTDLYDESDDRLYDAPWRPDPRPLGALLQGAYAHIAVADFWFRRTRSGEGAEASEAARHFHRLHPMILNAITTLQESASLTGMGEQFVLAMRRAFIAMVSGA